MKKRSRGRGHARRKGRSGVVDKWQAKAMKHMPTFTPQLLKLFVPRPPLPPPTTTPPLKKQHLPYTGLAQFVCNFADPGDPEYAPSPSKPETSSVYKACIHALQLEQGAQKAALDLESYDPHHDPSLSGDPYKTLFVSNISFDTADHKLQSEFEVYGPIKRVRIVHDSETGKSKGYAFIEYLHTRDMKAAYKKADGKKIDGRRVIVDVERGRTMRNWRPRRLGGGLGSTRLGNHANEESVEFGPNDSNGGASRGHMEMDYIRNNRRDAYDDTHAKEKNRANDTHKFHNEHYRKRVHKDDPNQHDCIDNSRRAYLRANGNRRTHGDDRNRYDDDLRRTDGSRDKRTHDPDGKLVNGDRYHSYNSPDLIRKHHSQALCNRYHGGDVDMECIGQNQDNINELRFNKMEL